MTTSADPYHKWLGIPPAEQPPTHYRLLGIAPYESDPDVIERAADQRMGYVRSLSIGKHAEIAQRILNEIATAKLTLLTASEKAAYDKSLVTATQVQPAPRPRKLLRAQPLDPAPAPLEKAPVTVAPSLRARVHRRPALWQQPIVLAVAGVALLGIIGAIWLMNSGATADVASVASNKESPKPLPADKAAIEPPAPPPVRPSAPSTTEVADDALSADTAPEPSVSEPAPEVEPASETPPPVDETTAQVELPSEAAAVEESIPASPVAEVDTKPAADALAKVPDAAARQAAGKLVDEIYGGPYRSSKTDKEKAALAAKMLNSARESKNEPAAMYVLLERVRLVGALTGKVDLIDDAIAETASHFDVDRLQLLVSSLESASSKTFDRERQEALAARTLQLAADVAASERFDLAPDLVKSLENHAQRARSPELRTQVRDGLRDVKLQQQQWQQAQAALDVLTKDAQNPAAHLTVGKYLALTKGDWDQALPHLSQAGDGELAKVAAMDIAATAGGSKDEQLRLGDAWHDYAAASKANEGFLNRAAYWYRLVSPQLSGLPKAKVDNRLAAMGNRATSTSPGVEKIDENSQWMPLADKGYLTQCYTLGPFKTTEINDGLVFAYLRKHKPDEQLQGRQPQPVEATTKPLYGKTVPTFTGPDEFERFMYYVFEVKVDKDQTVTITGESFFNWGHNKIYVAVDALPVPNGSQIPLRRGAHSVVVKQHFIKMDRPDRSFVRLQVEGESVLQKATLGISSTAVYLDDMTESDTQLGIGFGKHGKTQDGDPITFQGKNPKHSIYTHGKANGSVQVTYRLQGKYETFKATAGLTDPAVNLTRSASPLTFVVLGDGKELWRSEPQQTMGAGQACDVAIREVNELTLRVDCPGKYDGAWALWVDPLVTNDKAVK